MSKSRDLPVALKDLHPPDIEPAVTFGFFFPNSKIEEIAEKVISIDPYIMTRSKCDPINGLDYECIDSDWVPAIDNELIDVTGNQYEESYRHYLQLARIAAERAKELRSYLIEDIITASRDEKIEEAQTQTALDNYIIGMTEICGDVTVPSDIESMYFEAKEEFDSIVETNPNITFSEVLKERLLESEMFSQKDCFPQQESRNGPLLCNVDKVCDSENPVTLGDMGIFSDAEPDTPGIIAKAHPEFNIEPKGWCHGVSDPPTLEDILHPLVYLDEIKTDVVENNQWNAKRRKLLCWISEYNRIFKWYLKSQNFYAIPELFKAFSNEKGSVDEYFGEFIEELFPSHYGSYYEGLSNIATDIEHMRQAANSHLADIEDMKTFAHVLYYAMKKVQAENEIRIAEGDLRAIETQKNVDYLAWQLLVTSAQAMSAEMQISAQTKSCVQQAKNQHELYGKKEWEEAIRELNSVFETERPSMFYLDFGADFGEVNNYFTSYCSSAIQRHANHGVLGMYGGKICEILERDYLSPCYYQMQDDSPWKTGDTYELEVENDKNDGKYNSKERCCTWAQNLSEQRSNPDTSGKEYMDEDDYETWGRGSLVLFSNGMKKDCSPGWPSLSVIEMIETGYSKLIMRCKDGIYSYEDADIYEIRKWNKELEKELENEEKIEDVLYENLKYGDLIATYGTMENRYVASGEVVDFPYHRWDKNADDKKGYWAYTNTANICVDPEKVYSDNLKEVGGIPEFEIPEIWVEDVAGDLRKRLQEEDFLSCDQVYNECTVDTSGRIGDCEGSESFEEIISSTKELENSMEDWNNDIEGLQEILEKLYQDIRRYDTQTEAFSITREWISKMGNVSKKKSDISNLIREVSIDISRLLKLEDAQVYLFNTLVNDTNISKASSYSSLAEWNRRFDFRLEEYKQQVKRAKMAAWIARRAVEFRFGIDLSKESERTIHGDIPSEWADEIYTSIERDCVNSLRSSDQDTPDEGNTDIIDSCLNPDERVENYIQKLEDYVESYGNSPDQNWWFHEDDDVGILSLRDNFAIEGQTPYITTSNLLFFSEELDMDEDSFADTYEPLYSYFGVEYVEPSTWASTQAVVLNDNDTQIDRLGIPHYLIDNPYQQERQVFADQQEMLTAELVKMPSQGLEQLTQSIDLEEATAEVGPIDELNFSLYLRHAPSSTECSPEEIYAERLGTCAVPCILTPESPIAGDCPYAGQVCLKTDDEFDDETDDVIELGVCNWCSASRGCLNQDGISVGIGITQDVDGAYQYAHKNVSASQGWQRRSVNTVDDQVITSSLVAEEGAATVALYNTSTENLIASSELIDTSQDWSVESPAQLVPTAISAPDQTVWERSDVLFPAGTDVGTIAVSTPVLSDADGQFTGSIWLTLADTSVEQLGSIIVELQTITGGQIEVIGRVRRRVSTGQWARVEVSGNSLVGGERIQLQMYPEVPEDDGLAEELLVGLWGAQIERGTDATIYLPTGKNLLLSSDDLLDDTNWISASTGLAVEKQNDVSSPNGRSGPSANVFMITDSNTGFGGSLDSLEQTITKNVGDAVTVSLWARAIDDTVVQDSRFRVYYGVGWNEYEELQLQGLNHEWQRFTFVQGSLYPDAVNSDYARIRIIPNYGDSNTGALYLFGPQIEYGVAASGYQETDEDPTTNIKVWDVEIGAVGAQLTKESASDCDNLGRGVLVDPQCEDRYQNIRSRCCENVSDWTGDNEFSDLPTFYGQCMTCDNVSVPCTESMMNCFPEAICEPVNDGSEPINQCGNPPETYVRNTYVRKHVQPGFEMGGIPGVDYPFPHELQTNLPDDVRYKLFKDRFKYVAPVADKPGYYAYWFDLDMDRFERGSMGMNGIFAPNNFNYRLRTVAVNVVGTDVINCNESNSPQTCAANQWLSYDLKQWGNVRIRNHHKEQSVREFKIPTGRVSGGKAWSAEQVIGYPVSSAHNNMLAQINKIALMGRPLQGTFELRIYDTPELEWENLEDIQLVIGYHYWTRSE